MKVRGRYSTCSMFYEFFFLCFCFFFVFFFKQKTAYEIVDCDWSSDVCSSDLPEGRVKLAPEGKSFPEKLPYDEI